MASWDRLLTNEDRLAHDLAGYGQLQGLGRRPALLVIDVTYPFIGAEALPLSESIAIDRRSCGSRGWDVIPHIRSLLGVARESGVPVVYTKGSSRAHSNDPAHRVVGKNSRAGEDRSPGHKLPHEIVKEVAPLSHEVVIQKSKASAFFGTQLVAWLIGNEIDQLVVVGGTTSGCVRATVVDAHSYNFRVAVVQDAVFDRWELSHESTLFDLNAKFADVLYMQEAEHYFRSL